MTKITKGALIVGATVLVAASVAFAATQGDLLLTNSSLGGGTANGFVGKGTVSTGGQVWVDATANYSQACLDEGEGSQTGTPMRSPCTSRWTRMTPA